MQTEREKKERQREKLLMQPKKSQMEAPSSSIVKNGGMYELINELIFSSNVVYKFRRLSERREEEVQSRGDNSVKSTKRREAHQTDSKSDFEQTLTHRLKFVASDPRIPHPPEEEDECLLRATGPEMGPVHLHALPRALTRPCIRHEVFHHVAQETSAYELWIKLEKMYQAKTSRNKALLMRRLVNLKLQRGTMAEHTSEFQNLVNQLASIDLYFDDEMQALLFLSSLPESWETLVVSLSNSAQDGKLTMSTIKNALFNEESQKKEMGTTD
ncbi:Endonuclease [Actinidia chinensis var. chinensis]|uniref:Endonuclease n=1 Tax=Actinidia chinensis var. chinensis TaxID=1590841 RepID=A0A2R6QG99_ACTCC|nr:Endonuclease [Actinidia chinensis var. chinensis]